MRCGSKLNNLLSAGPPLLQKVDHVGEVIPEGAFADSDEGDSPFLPIVSEGSGGEL